MATNSKRDKLDLSRLHREEYATPKSPTLVTIGSGKYLSVPGSGTPGSAAFEACIGALYGMAYTVKFQSKFAGRDFTVGKLEGLYGVGGQAGVSEISLEQMAWQLIIRVPDFIGKPDLEQARTQLREKGKEGDFDAVSLETIAEGRCVQMLHVGPYEDGGRTRGAMLAFAEAEGLVPHLWSHEIYLSDPRRVPSERLRTILRQPVLPGPSGSSRKS